MKKDFLNLRIPYTPQGKRSANCGPCSIKMLLDALKIPHHSVHSLNRQLGTQTRWGTDFRAIHRLARRYHCRSQKIRPQQIAANLRRGLPILCAFIDEEGGGHYALLKGMDRHHYIFHDPYFGKNLRRNKRRFREQARPFKAWLVVWRPADKPA